MVPMKGFKVVVYISFPFPKLSWRNCIDRWETVLASTRNGGIHRTQFTPVNSVVRLLAPGQLSAGCVPGQVGPA